jgi:N-acetylglucosamine kinase-like BadF-type ATPase
MTEHQYVGIDAGGSGTRAALATPDGKVLAIARAGPSGSVGGATGLRLLRRALESVLSPLVGEVGSNARAVHLGLRGLSIAGRREAALQLLAGRLPQARVEVTTDAAIALEGALAGQQGVAVLAGTGSIALARRGDGVEVRGGGFGYLVGDEGSGFWLGREAVAASLRSLDGRGPPTALGALLCEKLRLGSVADLVPWAYRGRSPVPRIAALAPLVARAAAAHDPVATSLLQRAAHALAELAIAVTARAWPDGPPPSHC